METAINPKESLLKAIFYPKKPKINTLVSHFFEQNLIIYKASVYFIYNRTQVNKLHSYWTIGVKYSASIFSTRKTSRKAFSP